MNNDKNKVDTLDLLEKIEKLNRLILSLELQLTEEYQRAFKLGYEQGHRDGKAESIYLSADDLYDDDEDL